ncbi:endoglucanase 16 [Nicotiana attenuata]|uniref:Endoglucanase n=1 Tax=Nicotiana attenuata TaxID=49451 RepID=A0A1J6IBY2_NICAT|nr:endoglucanase 16 [Nicotiana attenuata]
MNISVIKAFGTFLLAWFNIFQGNFVVVNGDFNYQEALTKSIIFLEAHRSGKIPPNHRPLWRGDSALQDGNTVNVDLVGGYYDAGDNSAIKWGTDYFLNASSKRNRLYVQVGDPVKDHECWTRPENMKTPTTVLMIDQSNPGTEVAAETSAAMAAASVVFRGTNRTYARQLINKAKLLFQFAKSHKETYDGECPFYCSFSGFHDELLWAATWLYRATRRPTYLGFIQEEATTATVAEFSWDLKYAGAQILLSKFYFEGEKDLRNFKQQADGYICSILPHSPHHQVYISPGGLLHLRDGANTQYVTATAFLFSVYSDYLANHKQKVSCGNKQFNSADLMAFAKQKMDYLLGKNPRGKSYMVGFGNKPPTQAHHRGASVPKMSPNKLVDCSMSFVYWYNTEKPNTNELTGAIVGGPDRYDNFEDRRSTSAMTEPTTYTNSLAVGVLAKLAKHHAQS